MTPAAFAVAVVVFAGLSPAAATETPPEADQTITVDGTLVAVAVDAPAGETLAAGLDIDLLVEVDGVLLDVPDGLAPATAGTGDDVTVTITADAGLAPTEVVEVASGVAPEGLEGAAAEVVGLSVDATAAASTDTLAEAAGTRTLTILPVYWTSPDGATQGSLQSLATSVAQYWSEQSSGRLTFQTDVRGWAAIATPANCTTAVFSAALAAHGVTESAGRHIVVYFPRNTSCGSWAGMGTVGDASSTNGRVWVNGYQYVDVTAHEIGHNIGLGHANTATCSTANGRTPLLLPLSSCTTAEYGDYADIMGIGMSMTSGNLNTGLADALGWAQVTRVSPGQAVTVDLAPLASMGAMRSVAISVSGGTVYVDFRPATGRDVRKTAWAGVQVHYRTVDGRGTPVTYLLDMKASSTSSAFSSPAMAAGAAWDVPGTGTVLTVQSVGSTARVSLASGLAAPVPSIIQRYVTNVYADLFNRGVDPVGLAGWTSALVNGTPRVAVANAITYSHEYRGMLVTASYQQYLGRAPDPEGLAGWVRAMDVGYTIPQMEAGFLASQEYYNKAGGTDAGWVTRLYQHVLGRSPAASEVSGWTAAVRVNGRVAVSTGFLLSSEHLSTVINDQYLTLLGRGLDAGGQAGWVRAIQCGTRLEAVIGGIIASDEYFNKA